MQKQKKEEINEPFLMNLRLNCIEKKQKKKVFIIPNESLAMMKIICMNMNLLYYIVISL